MINSKSSEDEENRRSARNFYRFGGIVLAAALFCSFVGAVTRDLRLDRLMDPGYRKCEEYYINRSSQKSFEAVGLNPEDPFRYDSLYADPVRYDAYKTVFKSYSPGYDSLLRIIRGPADDSLVLKLVSKFFEQKFEK